jgi:hypothetical protein
MGMFGGDADLINTVANLIKAGAYTRPLFSSMRALLVPRGGVLCWFQ